jgi:hypothetical protein
MHPVLVMEDAGHPGEGQHARIENLLAAVRDLMSSLRTMSGQLEFEVREEMRSEPRSDAASALETLKIENAQLRQAMERRGVIERAKGVVMVTYRCDEESAFQRLVNYSRHERRKVRDVAVEVVQAAAGDDLERLSRLPGLWSVPADNEQGIAREDMA